MTCPGLILPMPLLSHLSMQHWCKEAEGSPRHVRSVGRALRSTVKEREVKGREMRKKRRGGNPPGGPDEPFGSPGIVMIQYFNIFRPNSPYLGSSGSLDSPRHGSLCRALVGASVPDF